MAGSEGDAALSDVPEMDLGAAPPEAEVVDRVMPGTAYIQGGRQQIDVPMTVSSMVATLPRPDPDRPLPHNRKVDRKRAKAFANYLIASDDWIAPNMIIRVNPRIMRFQPVPGGDIPGPGNRRWGWVRIPHTKLSQLLTLDGQHRILGCFMAVETVEDKISEYHRLVEEAHAQNNPPLETQHRAQLTKWQRVRDRFANESVVFSLVETDDDRAKKAFLAINDNSKGVRADFKTILDVDNPLSRVAIEMMEVHPLLVGRVETGQGARFTPASEALVGASTVKAIVKAVLVGTAGTVPRAKMEELEEGTDVLAKNVSNFLDLLVEHTTAMRNVANGVTLPRDLRDVRNGGTPDNSMLGSSTMLRVLAAAYHRLLWPQPDDGKAFTVSQIGRFFGELEPFMGQIPINPNTDVGKMWIATGCFTGGDAAPHARGGDIPRLTQALVDWARNGIPVAGDEGASRRRGRKAA